MSPLEFLDGILLNGENIPRIEGGLKLNMLRVPLSHTVMFRGKFHS